MTWAVPVLALVAALVPLAARVDGGGEGIGWLTPGRWIVD